MPRGRSSSMVDYQYFCESHFQEMRMRSGFTPYIMQHVGSRIVRNPSRKCSVDACYHQVTWMLPEKFHIEIGVCRRCKGQHLKGDKFCPTCGGQFDEKQSVDIGAIDTGQDGVQKAIDIAMGV